MYPWARNAKSRVSDQSPSSEFTDLRMGKGFWQVFIGQEISLCLL